jgi:hypothetical protein
MTRASRVIALIAATVGAVAAIVGCGLGITSPDLFVLTRTGVGDKLTLLLNDGGSIKCNDRAPRPLAEPLLLQARDLATALAPDAKQHLSIPPAARSVAHFTVKLQDGTVSFPDTAGASHHELAQAELFAVTAAKDACGLKG